MKKSCKIQSTFNRLACVLSALVMCFNLSVTAKAEDVTVEGQAHEEWLTSSQAPIENNEPMGERSAEKSVRVIVNGESYKGKAFLIGSVTYVGFREFSMFMGANEVTWNSQRKTAGATSDSLSVSAKNNDPYITANGRYLWASDKITIRSGTMYVPLRTIAKAFGCTVTWNANEFSAYLSGRSTIESGSVYYDSDSVYWLARIIHAESAGEPLLGKVAVGSVVLNRVKSKDYPNTIYGVIFDKKNGVQFTPSVNGAIYCTPGEESIIAAKLCLDGATISDKALFFVNEAIAQSSWVSDNRYFLIEVGNHKFYA